MKNIKYIYIIILITSLALYGVYYLFYNKNEVIVISSLPDYSTDTTRGQLRGLLLAFEEENYNAGKHKIVLKNLNTSTSQGNSLELEITNAEYAASDKKVVAYYGPFSSGLAIASLPILNKAGILQLSGTMTWPGITKSAYSIGEPMKYYPTGKSHFFRVVPSDIVQGLVASSFMKQKNIKTVASIHDGGVYGKGVSSIFSENCVENGIQVLTTGSVEGYRANHVVINEIIKSNPDAVFVGAEAVSNISETYTDLRLGGYDGIILGTNFTEKQISDSINSSDIKVYTIDPGKFYNNENNKNIIIFHNSYKKRFGEEPPSYSYYAYISGKLIISAIANSNGTRKDVLNVFRTNPNSHVVNSNQIHFDTSGDIIEGFSSIFHMENGSWVFIQSINI